MVSKRFISVLLSVLCLPCLTAFGQAVKLSVKVDPEPKTAADGSVNKAGGKNKYRVTGSITGSNLFPKGQLRPSNNVSVQLEYIDAGGTFRTLPDWLNLRHGEVKGKTLLTAAQKSGIKAHAISVFRTGLGAEHEGKAVKFDKVLTLPPGAADYRIVASLTHTWSGTWTAIVYKHDVQALSVDKTGNVVSAAGADPNAKPETPNKPATPNKSETPDKPAGPAKPNTPGEPAAPTPDGPKVKGSGFAWVEGGKAYDETAKKVLKPGDRIHFGHRISTGKEDVEIWIDLVGTHVRVKKHSAVKLKKKINKKKQGGVFAVMGRLWSLFKGKTKKNGYAVETHNSVAGCSDSDESDVYKTAQEHHLKQWRKQQQKQKQKYRGRELAPPRDFGTTSYETAYDPKTGKTTLSVFEGIVPFKCKNCQMPPMMVEAGSVATIDNKCNHTLGKLPASGNTPAKAGWITSTSGGNTGGGAEKKLSATADAHVYAYTYRGWNKANWGAYNVLAAGTNPLGGQKRSFLKFDLTGVKLGPNDRAILRLYHYLSTGPGAGAAKVGIYEVTELWKEGTGTYPGKGKAADGVTWVNQPKFARTPAAVFSVGKEANKFVEVDITPLVKRWVNKGRNYGLMLGINSVPLKNGKAQEAVFGFYAREQADPSKRPALIIRTHAKSTIPKEGPLKTRKNTNIISLETDNDQPATKLETDEDTDDKDLDK